MTQAPPNIPKETDCEVREFQLYKTASDDETIWSAVEDTGEFENMIHVISFSAFEKLRKEHSLMQERLDVVGKESLEINGRLLKENAQLSATCERYRGALEKAAEHKCEGCGLTSMNCEITEALESGERSGDD